jgi:hypothetical protein
MNPQDQFDALFDQQEADSHTEEMDALLNGNVVAHSVIGQSADNITKTYQVDLSTGITAFFKSVNEVRGLYADGYGHTKVSATLAEIAAWRLARALGSPFEELVPTTVARFLGQFDSHAPGALSIRRPGIDSTPAPLNDAPDQVSTAALFDGLIGQQDRNGHNFLWDAHSGRLSLIDHGFSLARPGDLTNETFFVKHRWNTGAGRLTAAERAALQAIREDSDLFGLDSWIEPERVAALRGRAERMSAADSILPPGSF